MYSYFVVKRSDVTVKNKRNVNIAIRNHYHYPSIVNFTVIAAHQSGLDCSELEAIIQRNI